MSKNKIFQYGAVFLLGLAIGAVSFGLTGNSEQNTDKKKVASETCDVEISEKNLNGKLGQEVSEKDLTAAEAFLTFRDLKSNIIPSGIPTVYGKELNVSYDEVQDAIDNIKVYGPDYGKKRIELSDDQLERYNKIGSQTSCEYCCGVKTLVKSDGSAACGCDHSIMMRGLTAYLLKNHPDLSNEEILATVNNWKATFFPQQTLSGKLDQMKKSGNSEAAKIMEEFPQFMPEMVGGC